MRKILLISVVLALSGCQSTNNPSVVTKYKVVQPVESMYSCPIVTKWPNHATLTDIQVAKTLVELHKNNVKCKNSIEAIKKFLNRAQQVEDGTLEQKPAEEQSTQPAKFLGLF